MPAVNTYNFEHISGDTLMLHLTLNQDGAPLDLTGVTVRSGIARKFGDTAPVVTPEDISAVVGAAGTVTITVPADHMKLPAGKYVYDVQLTFSDGVVQTILVGEITLFPDVS